MSKIHLLKLTRTACGCKITKNIRSESNPHKLHSLYHTAVYSKPKFNPVCLNCAWSTFALNWREEMAKIKSKYRGRFGTTNVIPDDVFAEISHKKMIEEYQNKDFRV